MGIANDNKMSNGLELLHLFQPPVEFCLRLVSDSRLFELGSSLHGSGYEHGAGYKVL